MSVDKERKRGKLSVAEMRFIEENCYSMDIEDIAKELNRTEAPIKKYIEKCNLKARDLTDHEYLINELRSKFFFHELKYQFTEDEIEYFEHMWIEYILQFSEDVTHTEELQIIEVIRTEILINRSMRERRSSIEQITILEKIVRDEINKPNPDAATIATNQGLIAQLQAAKGSFTKEHKDLSDKKDKLMRDLKGTRDQRKKNSEDITTNFGSWLRALDDEENRKREAVEMEIQAIAADKAFGRLSEYHEYVDGEVDQPIYTTETLIDDRDLTNDEKLGVAQHSTKKD